MTSCTKVTVLSVQQIRKRRRQNILSVFMTWMCIFWQQLILCLLITRSKDSVKLSTY